MSFLTDLQWLKWQKANVFPSNSLPRLNVKIVRKTTGYVSCHLDLLTHQASRHVFSQPERCSLPCNFVYSALPVVFFVINTLFIACDNTWNSNQMAFSTMFYIRANLLHNLWFLISPLPTSLQLVPFCFSKEGRLFSLRAIVAAQIEISNIVPAVGIMSFTFIIVIVYNLS